MIIKGINILNFKNIAEASLEFSDNVNCFVGMNGMGKSNFLDAIYYLSYGKSFSNMPDRMAEWLMERVPNVQWAAVCLSLFAGIISAFVDNVATVLMVAPVAIAVCRKLETNPVPFIISIAVSSNLQGAATLVGDTTAIMLGSALNLSFADFFWYQGRPSIFFSVELGAVLSALIVFFLFRKEKKAVLFVGARN